MMKTRLSVSLSMLGLSMLAAVISGCAADRIDLVNTGMLTLEKQATGKVYFAWCGAYEQADGFVITGVLRRCDYVGHPIKAHVDVKILSPDGRIIDTARSNYIYVPRRITGKGQSLKRFRVHFPNVPPQGSSIQVVSHSGLHNDET